jgi:demethylphylloquinone reductase
MAIGMTRICILGGGFGGLYTALRLSQLPWEAGQKPEIVLVDQRDRFVFLPLLYELVTGEMQSWEIAPSYAELLVGTGIEFRQATVESIHQADKTVELGAESNHALIQYDRLVIAMGGETPLGRVPGSADHALLFRTLEDAQRLSDRLRVLEADVTRDRIRVAVIGAGYSGVELACNVAERLGDRGRIRLVELGNKILRVSPEFNRNAAEKALTDRSVWLDLDTSVESMTADTITLKHQDKSDTIPVDLVLWTVGTQVVPVVQALAVPKTDRGQIRVNAFLQVDGESDLYALGDLADSKDVNGQPIPTTAQAAFQQADYVGWNVWASLTHRPLLAFRYQHLGEMMTLGSDDATMAGLGVQLKGVPAHVARRMIYLLRMPTFDHQVKVGMSWLMRPIVDWLKLDRS